MLSPDEMALQHRRAWELIPWVVNGRADPEERRQVEDHLRDCGDCREELEFQRRLQLAMSQEPASAPADPQPALERLWRRIDAGPVEELEAPAVPVQRRARRLTRGLLAAVIVEAIALSALSAAWWARTDAAAPYRTLTTATATSRATVRAVLAPALTLEQTQALLNQAGLQIVGGPSEAGVYSLAPAAGSTASTAAALALLRAQPGVRFAEPVAAAQ